MYIRCCDCLRESKSSTLIRILNSRETSAEAALITSFSVCPISISPPTDDQREGERERDANDEMKLWAIYKGLQIIGLFIWVDLTRPNNLDNIRSWTLGFLTLPKQYYQSIYIRGCKFSFYVAQKKYLLFLFSYLLLQNTLFYIFFYLNNIILTFFLLFTTILAPLTLTHTPYLISISFFLFFTFFFFFSFPSPSFFFLIFSSSASSSFFFFC